MHFNHQLNSHCYIAKVGDDVITFSAFFKVCLSLDPVARFTDLSLEKIGLLIEDKNSKQKKNYAVSDKNYLVSI